LSNVNVDGITKATLLLTIKTKSVSSIHSVFATQDFDEDAITANNAPPKGLELDRQQIEESDDSVAFDVTTAFSSPDSGDQIAFAVTSNNDRWTEYYPHEAGPTLAPRLIIQTPSMLLTSVQDAWVSYSNNRNYGSEQRLVLLKDRREAFVAFDISQLSINTLLNTLSRATLTLDVKTKSDTSLHTAFAVSTASFDEMTLTGANSPMMTSPLDSQTVISASSRISFDVTAAFSDLPLDMTSISFGLSSDNTRWSEYYSKESGMPPVLLLEFDDTIPQFQSECLGRSGPRVTIENIQEEQGGGYPPADGTVYDATTATWPGQKTNGEFLHWTVTMRYNGNVGKDSCWYGGFLSGAWDENDPDVTWEDPYHHAGGFTCFVPDFLLEGVRIHNQGDGIHVEAPDMRIHGAYLSDIHDDCVENDEMHTLSMTDSLLDGCYVGLSARGSPDGSDNVWEIRDSLIRLEAQPTIYKPERYGPAPGHGGFFKWDDNGSPRVALHGNIFQADEDAIHGTLGLPDSLVFESCSNNIVVWGGSGPFPGGSLPEDCFTVTTDTAVWDDAALRWKQSHGYAL